MVFVLGLGWGFGFFGIFLFILVLLVKVIFLFFDGCFVLLVNLGNGSVVFFLCEDILELSLDFIFMVFLLVEFNGVILGIWDFEDLGVEGKLEKEIVGRVFWFFLILMVVVFVDCFFGVDVCVLGLFVVVIDFLNLLWVVVGVVFLSFFWNVVVVNLF